jgi:hypothetical protein
MSLMYCRVILEKDTLKDIFEFGWGNVLPGFDFYPECFRGQVIPFLTATLMFHYNKGDLHDLYPRDHPIFDQNNFTEGSGI